MRLRQTTSVRHAVRNALGQHPRVVLAVSGGLDSMVLLDAAAATIPRSRLLVATFDHGTGPAATAAQRHVERCSAALGIECVSDTAAARASSEVAFREARWRFLRRLAEQALAVVATAHTLDDQLETIVMRVLRDAGARGLAGLYAESDILRPLLHCTRRNLTRYARTRGVAWIEDPSNASRRYLRNRIRHDVLPALRRVRPSIDAELLAIAREAAEWRRGVEAFVRVELGVLPHNGRSGLDVSARALAGRSAAESAVLWPAIAALAGVTLDRRGTRRVAAFTANAEGKSRVGARIQLSGAWEVIRSRDAFQLRPSNHGDPRHEPHVLSVTDGTRWGAWSFRSASTGLADDAWSAWLPIDCPLSVRPWRPGDTMSPRAGASSKKVKVLLSKAGITGHDRPLWPVVLAGDQIVWIPGVRCSEAATVRSGRPGLAFVCEHHYR